MASNQHITEHCSCRKMCRTGSCKLTAVPSGAQKDDIAYSDDDLCENYRSADDPESGRKTKEVVLVGIWKKNL